MDVEHRTPADFEVESLVGQNSIIIGAPYVGKTHLFDETSVEHTRVERLKPAVDTPDDEFVVLDEFYTAYQRATAHQQDAFESWLDREGGVCLVTRPHDIDWLLESDESPLSKSILNAFDVAYLLQYSPESDEDYEQAIQNCLSIVRDDVDESLDRDALETAADDLFRARRYEFDNQGLRERLGVDAYEETLVPALVVYISDQFADAGGVISAAVLDQLGDVVENASVGQFWTDTKDICSDIFSWDTLSDLPTTPTEITAAARTLGSDVAPTAESPATAVSSASALGLAGGVVPSALIAGGSLGLYLYLRDGDDEELAVAQTDVFQALLGEELPPPARADLEVELGLPPRTIANFQRLVRGDTIDHLLAQAERLDESVAALPDQLAEVRQTVAAHEDDLQALEELLAELEETALDHTDLAAFVATSIDEATSDVDDFRDTVRAEEAKNVLQIGSVDDVPPYYGEEDTELFEAVADEGADLIVLRGSHGTGKTTAAYRACDLLSQGPYDVRLPNFDDTSREAIRYSLTATNDETVVFASYKRGTTDANTIRNSRDFRALLRWLDKGYCGTVVLECREELFRSLDSEVGEIEDRYLKQIWQDSDEIEFEALSDEDIESVVEWVLDRLEFEGEREELVNEAVRVADGNPEIAKIAARFALTDEKPLRDVDTHDELIWSDIDRFFKKDTVVLDDGRAIGGQVFEYTAATRRIQTAELGTILGEGVEEDQLGICARYLSGYLGGDVREAVDEAKQPTPSIGGRFLEPEDEDDGTVKLAPVDVWTLSPDIYGDVVFRVGCLSDGIRDRGFDHYLDEVRGLDNEERYLGLAENLGQAYVYAMETDDDEFQQTVATKCHELLTELTGEDVSAGVYARCLDELVTSRVPVAPWHLKKNIPRFVTGINQEHNKLAGTSELEEPDIAMNRLAHLYRNHYEFGSTDQLKELDGIVKQTAGIYLDNHNQDPAKFSTNVYSFVVAILATEYQSPDHIDEWIDGVERRVIQISGADGYDGDARQLLENFYSLIILHISQLRPTPESVSKWVEGINHRVIRTSCADQHEFNPSSFLPHVYSLALARLADKHPKPGNVSEWVEEINRRAIQTANTDIHNVQPSEFLESVYSVALEDLADKHPTPEHVREWIDEIEYRAIQTADVQNLMPSQFLPNVYSLMLVRVATTYPTPESASEWLDEINRRAVRTADSSVHDDESGQFLANTYSMALQKMTVRRPTPEDVSEWIEEIDRRAIQTTEADTHNDGPAEFLANVYSLSISRLSVTYPIPEDASEWINEVERRAIRAADTNAQDLAPSQFLPNVYSLALQHLTQLNSTPEDASKWVDEVERRAIQTANTDTHNFGPGDFLINVYSLSLAKLAGAYPTPDDVSIWVEEIKRRATRTADIGAHELSPERFLSTAFAMALGRLPMQSKKAAEQWYPFLVRSLVETVNLELLPHLCKALETVNSEFGYDVSKTHVRFARGVLAAAVREDDPLGSGYEDRVARVATVLAAIVHLLWKRTGLDGEYFETIVTATIDLNDSDPQLYADIVEEVPDRLDEHHDNLIAGLDWQQALE